MRCTRLQCRVQGQDLIHFQRHVRAHVLLETLQSVFHSVVSRRNFYERVVAILVRLRITADAGGFIGQRDLHSADNGAGRICDATNDAAAGALAERWSK